MKIIDLSHRIEVGMPVYPGTAPPELTRPFELDKDGFAETKISVLSHTGTHMDAPAHIIAGGITLDRMPVSAFYGRAICIESVSGRQEITKEDLMAFESGIQAADFVFFRTGWSRLWGQTGYFEGYPALTAEAAVYLNDFTLKGVGFDTISADAPQAHDFTIHKIILGKNRIIIENLTHLDQLPPVLFSTACFPLHFSNSDGSPVRAVAFIE